MKGAALGAKWFVSAGKRVQAVVPTPFGLSGPFQSKAAPPHAWTSIPRWDLYQAPRALGSLDLKKIPPIPVTRFMTSPVLERWRPRGCRGLTVSSAGQTLAAPGCAPLGNAMAATRLMTAME